MEADFEEVVTTRDRLRELVKPPSDLVRNKAIDRIDDICRRFIAASPFVMIATRGADGRLDVSPKGDPAGFSGRPRRSHARDSGPAWRRPAGPLLTCWFIRRSGSSSSFRGITTRCGSAARDGSCGTPPCSAAWP